MSTPILDVANAIAPGDAAVVRKVRRAIDDPKGYAAAHRAGRFRFEVPAASVPWLALVDALLDANRLAEVDWRSDREELVRSLRALVGLPRAALPKASALRDVAAWANLPALARHLRARGLSLLMLEIASDSYPLVVVPKAASAKLVRLARAAGQVIRVAGPRRARPAPEPTPDEERARLTSDIRAGRAVRLARETRDPLAMLEVLAELQWERRKPRPRVRMHAAALLARRLRIGPESAALGTFVSSVWLTEEADAREVLAVPSAERTFLARLADEIYLAPELPGLEGCESQRYRLLAFVGDAESARLLEEREPRNRLGRLTNSEAAVALSWLARRLT